MPVDACHPQRPTADNGGNAPIRIGHHALATFPLRLLVRAVKRLAEIAPPDFTWYASDCPTLAFQSKQPAALPKDESIAA